MTNQESKLVSSLHIPTEEEAQIASFEFAKNPHGRLLWSAFRKIADPQSWYLGTRKVVANLANSDLNLCATLSFPSHTLEDEVLWLIIHTGNIDYLPAEGWISVSSDKILEISSKPSNISSEYYDRENNRKPNALFVLLKEIPLPSTRGRFLLRLLDEFAEEASLFYQSVDT